jgi:hypothetical protein
MNWLSWAIRLNVYIHGDRVLRFTLNSMDITLPRFAPLHRFIYTGLAARSDRGARRIQFDLCLIYFSSKIHIYFFHVCIVKLPLPQFNRLRLVFFFWSCNFAYALNLNSELCEAKQLVPAVVLPKAPLLRALAIASLQIRAAEQATAAGHGKFCGG